MTETIRDSRGRTRVRTPHDGRSYDEHQLTPAAVTFACRCRWCDATFRSPTDAIECPACLEQRTRAEQQTSEMATESGERWRYSRAGMRDYLGVSGNTDD